MQTILETDNNFVCEIDAPCFQSLTQDEIEIVKRSRTQVQFWKGENLAKQGAFASYILFVIKGLAKIYVEDESDRKYNITIVQAGDFVGLSAVFEKPVFEYSAVAITDTQVYLVDKSALYNIIHKNSDFAYKMMLRYSNIDRSLHETIKKLIFKQMNGRMADVLLYLSSERFANEEIFINLSRKDIADFVGISTESAVKLLKSFEKDEIIKLEEKNIHILNKKMLEEISKRG